MPVYPFSQATNVDPNLESIAIELDAMQAIAKVLAGIRDPNTRQRVLQWANERFNAAPDGEASAPRPVRPADGDDADLAVESLYEFFERPDVSTEPPPSQPAAAQPARAHVAPAPAPVTAAPVRELRAVREVREPREEQTLDTMVKGFASELQRLAIEWQTS